MPAALPFTPDTPLRIGTRQSPLALRQAQMVAERLCAVHALDEKCISLVPMVATGDRVQDRALAEIGGKALWTKELDHALGNGEIDCAVHSMKDVETIRPVQFRIAAMLERADPRDRLIGASSLDALPKRARFGTASPRRTAQLLRIRPDLDIALIRGNVATRIARIESGEFAATLLAAAGLDRLGQHDVGTPLPIDQLLPAPSQGAIGIEACAEDDALCEFLAAADHEPTNRCVRAERAFLEALGADCRSPVAAHAVADGAGYRMTAQIFSSDGSAIEEGECTGDGRDFSPVTDLARSLLARAPDCIGKLFPG